MNSKILTATAIISSSFFFGCVQEKVKEEKPKYVWHQKGSLNEAVCDSAQEGRVRQGFMAHLSPEDPACARASQVCRSGQWQGPVLRPTCKTASMTKSTVVK